MSTEDETTEQQAEYRAGEAREEQPETPLAERARMFSEEYRKLTEKSAGKLIDTGSQNITGYRPQPEANRDLVNKVKELERFIAKWLQITYFAADVALDPRQVASARTHFEYALYHLNRAVFQPADPIGDAIKAGPNR